MAALRRASVVGVKHDPTFTPAVVKEVEKLLNHPVKPIIFEEAGHFLHIQAPRN
ncbi:hypothetical protein [Alkalihalobacillus sp. BA299]|uniref:hypothetical protein n=1 Tax=Alkalihalobacillus sp. BA299 TaxID=2815938 RepID=UPI001AD9EAD3|nr:hypothetical protein [Alkalihalobacillus sp. BA299]